MSKYKFKYYMRLSFDEEIDSKTIRKIIGDIKKSIPNSFSPLEDGTAVVYGTDADKHVYDFNFARSISVAESEAILEILNGITDLDYIMEITTTERFSVPEGEAEIDISSMRHNAWVSKQVNEGWRYGLQFNNEEKTDPRLRPYHELTDKLKNM
jgi:hypothetical protein